MKILSNAAMREVERVAIEELGVPGIVLMENAALGVVEAALAEIPDAESAVVFCGPGNNGGDGLAIARHLAVRGLQVVAVMATGGRELTGDAGAQFAIARNMAGMGLELRFPASVSEAAAEVAGSTSVDMVIDALFGSGLARPLEGAFADLAASINELEVPIIGVDLPSGLDGDRAEPPGVHVQADLTVAFAAPRPAHVLGGAADACGTVVVADLGVPVELVERANSELFLLRAAELEPLLAPRPRASHKGDFGHLLIVAGSTGKSGAAVLAARAAVRAGAGLVTAAVPAAILDAVEAASLETMSLGLPASGTGELSAGSRALLEGAIEGKDAVALGPGLGVSPETSELVRSFCVELGLPLVLDADGLNAFAGRIESLASRTAPTTLTPHPGELARLMGVSTAEIVSDRLGWARRAAERSAAVVLLKGRSTLIADPEGGVYVNPTGNPGMATGGSGDVLTGVIGALLAQGFDVLAATQLGAFVHGMAGDAGAASLGERSLAAGDLLSRVPASFDRLARWTALGAEGEAGP